METNDRPVKKEQKVLDMKLLKRLFPYVRKHVWLLSFSMIFMVAMDITGVLHPYLVKVGIDTNIAANDIDGLMRTCGLLGLMLFAELEGLVIAAGLGKYLAIENGALI